MRPEHQKQPSCQSRISDLEFPSHFPIFNDHIELCVGFLWFDQLAFERLAIATL
jgi:hypothetical protein